MESKNQYIKPSHKILARFLSECANFLMEGKNVSTALIDFPHYYRYNRRMISPHKANKPWIVHRAYLRLNSLLKPEMSVLEFGSGGSTLFLAGKVASILSIEHDQLWFREIHSQLEVFPEVRHILVPAEWKSSKSEYRSENGLKTAGLDFEKYAHAADHLTKESIDLLIIDGRVRPQCLINTVSKLKSGGILVFDNSERKSYKATIGKVLTGWKHEFYSGVTVYDPFFNCTSLYFKP